MRKHGIFLLWLVVCFAVAAFGFRGNDPKALGDTTKTVTGGTTSYTATVTCCCDTQGNPIPCPYSVSTATVTVSEPCCDTIMIENLAMSKEEMMKPAPMKGKGAKKQMGFQKLMIIRQKAGK